MFDFDSREEILWAMVKPGVWRHHVLLIDASSFMGKSSINDIYVPFPYFQYRTVYIYIYTRKTPVSPSPKLSFVPFCSSCRRNAFFSMFKFKKMHFDLRPPMNLSMSILCGRRSFL